MARQAILKSLGDVDVRLLRVFVVVAACNGIAASELELNIGKSTISRHISDLEARLGLRLCNRGPSGFSLTPEGEQVLLLTVQLLARIDEFRSGVDAIQSTMSGTIRFGLYDQSSANPKAQIDKAIAKFDELAPNVTLEISLDPLTALEANVVNGSLDLAVMPIYQTSSLLTYTEIYSAQMSLYCGAGHPLFEQNSQGCDPKTTLSEHKYAGYSFNSPNMRATNMLGLERAASVKDEEALALLVQSGRYLGFLADHVINGIGGAGRFWPLFLDEISYTVPFAAITRKRHRPDRKTAAFLNCLIEAHA
ncbi:LysR family transcriptional regulator [Pelagimonas varians]|uniref:HTH-type transcriptional regulator GltR n=1 Tax=Pelagimonas varians TaxID=696760 RepID=A0A238KN94_9RHOB|nr:LysR family transcriptional regulator [Pelagimonas varians]PYG28875.1 LysR family transcriptional regulator [Pelagimonas varians]SMX44284.1 HTH-type transcriptional regulator GltR [Pelagimonas varians]